MAVPSTRYSFLSGCTELTRPEKKQSRSAICGNPSHPTWVRLFFVDGPRGFCQRHGKSYLGTPSKAWWEGGLLTGRAISISVSLGVVPLVLPRRGSPSTHRGRGWLRSTRSFRTASAPTKLATRRIQTRAWMKQRYWVAPACTSELHHGRGPGTARPFDDAGGDGTQAPPCEIAPTIVGRPPSR